MTMILGGNLIPKLIREKIDFYIWRNKMLLCNQEYHRNFRKDSHADFLVYKYNDMELKNRVSIDLTLRCIWYECLYYCPYIRKFTASYPDELLNKYVYSNRKLPENYIFSKRNIKEDIVWINDGKVTKYYHKTEIKKLLLFYNLIHQFISFGNMTMILGGNLIPKLIREKIDFYIWRNKMTLCNQEYHKKFRMDILYINHFPNLISMCGIYTNNKYSCEYRLPKNLRKDIVWINDGKVTKYYHKSHNFDLENN